MNEHHIPEHKERVLLLSDKISEDSVKRVMEKIFEINEDDRKKEAVYANWKRPPIRLFINSFGGSVYDGLALVDVIKTSTTPVHTICVGACMSMGLWVWLSGKVRRIGKHGTLMFHDVCSFVYDKTEGVKQELDEMLRLQKMFLAEITEVSSVEEGKLQDVITRKAEWYISAQEALALNLADGYYE